METIVATGRVSPDPAATYVYCVLHRRGKPAMSRPSKGLEGMGAPRLLDLGEGLWLVVADAPLERYGSVPIEAKLGDLDWVSRCALAHESVIAHMSRHGTVIPMKLFTLFSTDDRARSHFARTRKRIDRLIRRITGRDEWGVRVSMDERVVVKSRLDGQSRPTRASSGTAFLMGKKKEKDAARGLVDEARGEAERVFQALSRHADDERQRTPVQAGGSVRLLLDATFLVPSQQASRFKETVRALARALEPKGYRVTLTGPWPPYTFVAEPS